MKFVSKQQDYKFIDEVWKVLSIEFPDVAERIRFKRLDEGLPMINEMTGLNIKPSDFINETAPEIITRLKSIAKSRTW